MAPHNYKAMEQAQRLERWNRSAGIIGGVVLALVFWLTSRWAPRVFNGLLAPTLMTFGPIYLLWSWRNKK